VRHDKYRVLNGAMAAEIAINAYSLIISPLAAWTLWETTAPADGYVSSVAHGLSGTTRARPGLGEALAVCRADDEVRGTLAHLPLACARRATSPALEMSASWHHPPYQPGAALELQQAHSTSSIELVANRVVAVTRIHGIAGRRHALRDLMRATEARVAAEPGCLLYQFAGRLDDPDEYLHVQEWIDDRAFAAHQRSPAFEDYQRDLFDLLARPSDMRVHRSPHPVVPEPSGPPDPRSLE
jgi:quinol monooxygenase YgiN